MARKKTRPTLEDLKAEYAARGQKVTEILKTVDGNRYRYARVWIPKEQRQRDIYLGPVEPKRLRGLLEQKHVDAIRGQLHNAEDTGHATLAEALGKVLEAYEAEE